MKTRECKVSELDNETRNAVNRLLDGEEPLLCYENKEPGLFNSRTTVIVSTRHEIFSVNPQTIYLFSIMYLDEVVSISARLGGENNRQPELTLHGRGQNTFSMPFETEQILYTATNRLRKMVRDAKG